MRWLDSWFKKKMNEAFGNWLERRAQTILSQEQEIEKLGKELSSLKSEVEGIQQIAMKVPIEEYLLASKNFQIALDNAIADSQRSWGYPRSDIKWTQTNTNGIVSPTRTFEGLVTEHISLLLAGINTRYEGEDVGLYRMQIGDIRIRPFSVTAEIKQVIFLQPHYLPEENYFEIRQIEGLGTLRFSFIGATVYARNRWDQPEFEERSSITCFVCGSSVNSKEAIRDAELLKKYTGRETGILCCRCFKVAKAIIEGKGGEE